MRKRKGTGEDSIKPGDGGGSPSGQDDGHTDGDDGAKDDGATAGIEPREGRGTPRERGDDAATDGTGPGDGGGSHSPHRDVREGEAADRMDIVQLELVELRTPEHLERIVTSLSELHLYICANEG